MIWSAVIEAVRSLVFVASQLCGHSIGGGMILVSFAVRLALLPLTLRIALRLREHQSRIAALAPDLERLRRRHGDDRAALAQATMELYREHDIGLMPKGMLASLVIQMPFGAALYRAFSTGFGQRSAFLWIADLARPDIGVALVAAGLAGAVAALAPSTNRSAIAANMMITAFLAWRLTASVGLYWVASSCVSIVQAVLLRRSPATMRPA